MHFAKAVHTSYPTFLNHGSHPASMARITPCQVHHDRVTLDAASP